MPVEYKPDVRLSRLRGRCGVCLLHASRKLIFTVVTLDDTHFLNFSYSQFFSPIGNL